MSASFCRESIASSIMSLYWGLLKRGYHRTRHFMSPKHLQRYVNEFSGCLNAGTLTTIDRTRLIIQGLEGKRLRYRELTRSDPGFPKPATT